MASLEESIASQIDVMFRSLEEHANPLFAPSAFWKELCAKHIALLRQYGFGCFKRTVNFEYGQWRVDSLRNWQVSHALRQLLRSGQLPYIPFLARVRGSESFWPAKEPSGETAYRIYVALLWQLAVSRDVLGCLGRSEESLVGGPIDIRYRNRLISQDMAQSSLELNSIMRALQFKPPGKVAEVGGGSGRFAYLFMQTYPDTEYHVFDIPPALAISQNHLAAALGDGKVAMFDPDSEDIVPGPKGHGHVSMHLPYSLLSAPDHYFDLFVNVSSFDEMLPEQIECYFDLIDRKCSGWVYLKGFASRTGADATRPWGLKQFPYRPRWKLVHEGEDAVMPAFRERVYDLRSR